MHEYMHNLIVLINEVMGAKRLWRIMKIYILHPFILSDAEQCSE